MDRSLVVITGASSGIGAAFARRLASEHDLLLIARRGDRLSELASQLKARHGCNVETLAADLTVSDDLARVAERISHDPRLVLLINNAGYGNKGRFWETDFETQDRMHRLHITATLRLTHAALGNLIPKNRGGIINVASVAAFVRSPGSISYSATKSWMLVFTEGLYLELQSVASSVLVQALCPGFTYSEFHDTMGVDRKRLAGSQFWMSAEDVVDASLAGLRRGKLFVIPGWRYRVLSSVLTKLPSAIRLKIEMAGGRARDKRLGKGESPAQVQDANL